MLIDAGAVGVTCAKLSQAAALADGGITDILVANEIVHPSKVAALIELAAKCESLCVAVDDELVELRTVALELGTLVKHLAEGILNGGDMAADADLAADLLLDVGGGREVIGVDMRLD